MLEMMIWDAYSRVANPKTSNNTNILNLMVTFQFAIKKYAYLISSKINQWLFLFSQLFLSILSLSQNLLYHKITQYFCSLNLRIIWNQNLLKTQCNIIQTVNDKISVCGMKGVLQLKINKKQGGLALDFCFSQIRSYNIIMLAISNPFEKLIARLAVNDKFEKAIEQGLQRYQIKQYKIENLGPSQVFLLYNILSSKFYFNKSTSNLDSWFENELRLFVWLVIGFVYVEQKCISQLTLQDWQYFSQIFNNRNPEQLQFQALSILKKQNKFSKWAGQEIILLDKIIKSKNVKNKWNQIARELFLSSDKKYFRTSKQCRQYWINHLDPTPVKSQWKTQQDLQLVNAIKELGKKWAKVSKALGGRRTQHMVKNRFKSLYQLESKKMKAEFQQTFTEHQVINEMKTRLKKRLQQEKLFPYQSTTQEIQTQKKKEKAEKIQSAEGEVSSAEQNTSKNNLIDQFFEIQEKLESEDNLYEKLPLICQTLGSIDDNDEREIRLGPKIQTIFNDELHSFFSQIDFA